MFRGFFASAEDIAMISFFEFSNFSKMAIRMFEFSNVWIFECFGEKNLWFWTVLNHLKSEPKGKERPGDKGKKIWLGWTVNIINHVDYRIYFHWNVFHLDDLYRYQGVYFVFIAFLSGFFHVCHAERRHLFSELSLTMTHYFSFYSYLSDTTYTTMKCLLPPDTSSKVRETVYKTFIFYVVESQNAL